MPVSQKSVIMMGSTMSHSIHCCQYFCESIHMAMMERAEETPSSTGYWLSPKVRSSHHSTTVRTATTAMIHGRKRAGQEPTGRSVRPLPCTMPRHTSSP